MINSDERAFNETSSLSHTQIGTTAPSYGKLSELQRSPRPLTKNCAVAVAASGSFKQKNTSPLATYLACFRPGLIHRGRQSENPAHTALALILISSRLISTEQSRALFADTSMPSPPWMMLCIAWNYRCTTERDNRQTAWQTRKKQRIIARLDDDDDEWSRVQGWWIV